jgi:hypothetical protein
MVIGGHEVPESVITPRTSPVPVTSGLVDPEPST